MIRIKTPTLRGVDSNQIEIEQLFAKRNQLLENKCEALARKAKTKWFHQGERSNKYFLNILRKRETALEIDALEIDSGITKDTSKIKTEITDFYRNLYEKGGTPNIDNTFYQYIEKIPSEITSSLTSPLTKEQLFNTLKTCKDSAPGPDGIPYSYYKSYWHIFGDLLVQVWNDSIRKNQLPLSHRSFILRLLPKQGKDLTKISNWMPITLSNCDHKLITKCYAKRFTNILKTFLHPSQTAYLPGKQIQDNIRLLNIIKDKAHEPIIAALDAKKAFDSVNHDYIRRTLEEFGLENFVPIFDLLYKDQQVDIAINGDVVKGYNIKNGVKQGDSLSCILFILCIDPLIRNIENCDNIGRVEIGDFAPPKILAYADDVTCITHSKRSLKICI
jgi:hypothetical protein